MYAVGGHDGWSYLTTVERWDPQTRMWSYVAPMSTARSTVGVTVLGNKYEIGFFLSSNYNLLLVSLFPLLEQLSFRCQLSGAKILIEVVI